MKIRTIIALAAAAIPVAGAFAQNMRSDEECLRAVADNILRQPTKEFIGVENGVVYSSTADIPEGVDVRFASPLTEWHYSNGVLDMSMIRLGKFLGEEKYIDYAKEHVAFGFANYEYFKNTFRHDRNHWVWPFGQLWNFKELDDCGAMGAAVVNVYELDPQPEYKTYYERAAQHVMYDQVRLPDGTLSRTFPRNMTVWADDVYMSVSLLSQVGKITGDNQYFDMATKQIVQITDYLWDETKGLYYHCYYADIERNGVAYWGRANGWIAYSIAMLLDVLPEDYPARDQLISLLERQIVGVSRYQQGNGMWCQLLDKVDSYDESSITAILVYSIAKAINEGWIDRDYSRIADAAWRALKTTQITEDGRFTNVCVGTGITDDLPFYYNRPVGENEKHGLGLVIDAGIEMMIMARNRPERR
ncbi:MAG: glycoside hydrolase family 88 protein [Alistipes sp.]|nr:glycoside hydrolase family 88 protein [Alistipes sp.]